MHNEQRFQSNYHQKGNTELEREDNFGAFYTSPPDRLVVMLEDVLEEPSFMHGISRIIQFPFYLLQRFGVFGDAGYIFWVR